MANIIIYLKYDGVLKYSVNLDRADKFKPIHEGTWVGLEAGDTFTWKVSSQPDQLEKIKVKKVNKKTGVILPKGSWKTQWTQPPTRVSDTEYTGQPNGEGATPDNPFAFAYDIDYKISSSSGWQTLDPGLWIPPPPPED
ncbi:MAG: hypothetical protein ACO2ZZ_02205 [Cyclobacteriaceae bacterium]